MALNKEVIAQWTEALRSGEYLQARGTLRKVPLDPDLPTRYCCWGVLCDLYAKTDEFARWKDGGIFIAGHGHGSIGHGMPPKEVYAWLGLQESNFDDGFELLASQNDEGIRFTAIADQIEQLAGMT